MTVETFFANFGHLADAPNGVQKLRELILQLAVQGKLVPQDPNDEPASALLEKIEAEKKRLVKEGNIKKQIALPTISSDEKPFVLPLGWEFVRLGSISNKIGSGSTPRGGKNAYVHNGVQFLRSQNIWNHGLELSDVAYIPEDTHAKMSNTAVYPNDILLNITGASLGRCTIFPDEIGSANVSQHVTIIRPTDPSIVRYLHLCILSPYTQSLVWGRQVGMAREGLSKKVLERFEIPLPPLEEQKRIVAKVDQLMALCDELEARQQKQQQGRVRLNDAALEALLNAGDPSTFAAHWQRICSNFDLLYDHPETIAKLRAAILQLAVQGKLVPQDPNDEPASVLLERITAEKERLVKEKQIRKEKPLPAIEETFFPFQLPCGWDWVRLGALCKVVEYGTSQKSHDHSSGVPVLRMNNIEGGKVHHSNLKYVGAGIKDLPKLYLKQGEILFNRTNSYELVGKSGVFEGEDDKFTFASYLIRASLFQDEIVPTFINYALNSSYFRNTQIEPEITQQCGQANFNGTKLKNTLIPLPSKAEQERIVTKVDQLMALCDELEAKLNRAQQHSDKLMEATVRQLLVA